MENGVNQEQNGHKNVDIDEKAQKNWIDHLALFISVILSPFLIIPAFTVIITDNYSTNKHEFIAWTFIIIFFSTIVPLLNVYIAVKMGKITDIHVAVREERKEPFVVAMISLLIATLILQNIGAPKEVAALGWVMLVNGILFFIITLYWKISMHLSIFAGLLVSLMALVSFKYIWGFLLLPVLIWARIRRRRHNIYQGIVATLLSAICTGVLLKFFGVNLGF
ncbi:MAG: hypothetical protein ACLFQV_08105 [Vulcanimicrobiota bacterium]